MSAELRKSALAIFDAALKAADPHAVCRDWASHQFQKPAGRVFVVGAGKASAAMAQGIEEVLGSAIAGGVINVKYGHTLPLHHIELNECGHPIPDENGVNGARRISALARQAQADDLVICLISGRELPRCFRIAGWRSYLFAEKQEVTRQLLACGANIHEMNTVRKHLSAIKGGQLAAMAEPARVVTLILSDVIGDNIDVIGSGPTAPDSSKTDDAIAVLSKYGIRQSPQHALFHETPKHSVAQNIVIGSNRKALAASAAGQKLRALRIFTLYSSPAQSKGKPATSLAHACTLCNRP